ncbi:MAG TPA: PDZ domain-containing protein [Candidatus Dormibacteraeota bacterium]|nr:PDZ domain-containing protein [Candidatus Dormibacteraeota bacterium]
MTLEPNARLGEPFEADMSGLGLRMGLRGFQVEWIQPGSPAAEAGIQPDDMIVDGKPADELGMPAVRELFQRAAETHQLVIRRGDQRRAQLFSHQ